MTFQKHGSRKRDTSYFGQIGTVNRKIALSRYITVFPRTAKKGDILGPLRKGSMRRQNNHFFERVGRELSFQDDVAILSLEKYSSSFPLGS
jgi:hypothetical protein